MVALVLALKCAPESQVDRLQRRHFLLEQLLLSLSFAELCKLSIGFRFLLYGSANEILV